MNLDAKRLVAIDVETTGPDPSVHQLLSVSLVPMATPERSCTVFVRYETLHWSEPARRYFQAYRTDWERDALAPNIAAALIAEFVNKLPSDGDNLFVGHNTGFDLSFLKQLFNGRPIPRMSHRTIDTHTMLRVLAWLGRIPDSACTSSGAFEYFRVSPPPAQRHTSLGDALATRELFLKLTAEYEALAPVRAAAGGRF